MPVSICVMRSGQWLEVVLFRENVHPFHFNTNSTLDHFQKVIMCLVKRIQFCIQIEAQPKKKHPCFTWERKQIPLYVSPLCLKLSMPSVLILDEQHKSSYTGNPTNPIIHIIHIIHTAHSAQIYRYPLLASIKMSTNLWFLVIKISQGDFKPFHGVILYISLASNVAL